MNKTCILSVAALTLSALAAVGCSSTDSGSGGGSSPSAAVSQIQNPTGSFDASNAASAFSTYASNQQASSGLSASQGSGTTSTQSLHTGSLHTLTETAQSGACTAGASCACPAGGSYVISQSSSDYGSTVQGSFARCSFEDGTAFDGDILIIESDKPLLKTAPLETAAAGAEAILIEAKGTFTAAGETMKADIVALFEQDVDYISVDVPDGQVLIGIRNSDGAAVVYAKDTYWTCALGAGDSYSCVDHTSGQTLTTNAPASSGAAASSGSSADEKR